MTSRSFAEYAAMFDLDDRALSGRVLDCSAGSSSFVAELADRGGDGVAVDPAYAFCYRWFLPLEAAERLRVSTAGVR